jgi:hypothetical protein
MNGARILNKIYTATTSHPLEFDFSLSIMNSEIESGFE